MFTKKDKINALWNSILFVSISILGLLNFTLNIKTFGAELYGVFLLINAIFGIGGNLDFGFGVSTVKQIAEAVKMQKLQYINSLVITILMLFIGLSIILFLAFYFYYLYFIRSSPMFAIISAKTAGYIFEILNISFIMRYITGYLVKIYEGFGDFIFLSKLSLVLALINTFSMFLIFLFHLSLVELSLFILGNSVLSLLSMSIFLKVRNKSLKMSVSYFDLRVLKRNAVHSLNIQLSFLIGSFVDIIIKFTIGKFLNLSYVTFYETAKKIIDISNGVIYSAQKGLLNKLSEANAIGELKEFVNKQLSYYSKMSNYYTILLYGLLNPFICYFVFHWFHYYEAMIILLMFMPSYALINFGGCAYTVLWVEGNGTRLLLIQSLNVVITFIFFYLTLSLYQSYLGLLSFYLVTLINSYIVFSFLKSNLSLDYETYFKESKFISIVILNIILFSEIFLLITMPQYLNYILFVYTILNFSIFYKYFCYLFTLVLKKIKSYRELESPG